MATGRKTGKPGSLKSAIRVGMSEGVEEAASGLVRGMAHGVAGPLGMTPFGQRVIRDIFPEKRSLIKLKESPGATNYASEPKKKTLVKEKKVRGRFIP